MTQAQSNHIRPSPKSWLLVAVTWTLVAVPLLWALWKTLQKAAVLFR